MPLQDDVESARETRSLPSFALRHPALVAALFAALLYLPWLAAAPIHGSLEANRLVAAREMYASGDWVIPTLNGQIYLAKPPFQYWLIDCVMSLSGWSALIAGRALSAVAVVGLAALLASYGRRTISARVGLIAGLGISAAGIFLEKGVIAELETVLAASTAIALCAFYVAVSESRVRLASILIGGIALGVAFLTKGPVALLFLLPAACALTIVSRGERRACLGVLATMLAIGVVTALPWVIAVLRRVGHDVAVGTLQAESIDRLHRPGVSNAEPWWFYVPGTLGALGLLVVLCPFLVVLPWRFALRQRHLVFLSAWAVLPLVLLSFSAGKEVRYVIASVPAWTLLLAQGLDVAWSQERMRGYSNALRIAARALSWIVPIAALTASFFLPQTIARSALFAAAFLVTARIVGRLATRSTVTAQCAVVVLATIGVKMLWALVYLGSAHARQPTMELGDRIAARIPPHQELLVQEYDSVLQLAIDRPMRVVTDLAQLDAHSTAFALTTVDAPHAPDWVELDSFPFRSKRYHLLRHDAH